MTKAFAFTAAALSLAAPFAFAQAPAAAPVVPGSIHGHVNGAAGQPLAGEIRLTKDRTNDEKARRYPFVFPVDKEGNYKGTGITPGTWVVFFYESKTGPSVDYIDKVVIKAGEGTVSNDDMTRDEFMKAMSPEERRALDEAKKVYAAQLAANKTVGNLNAMLAKSRDQQKAGSWDDAIATMKEATGQKADEAILWVELGNSNFGGKKYEDSITAFQKAVELNAALKTPQASLAGSSYNNIGQAYAKLGKQKEAADSYEKAATSDPSKASMYYFNEAAQLYNASQGKDAAAAADKAIAADPTKVDAYYLKGQSLVGSSSIDPKSQKLVPPPGCIEAYTKYLQLAPTGPHAKEVQEIMAAFDDKVVSTFKSATPAKK